MTGSFKRASGPAVAIAIGAAVFAAAAALRLPYLDQGLRHRPDYDERVFAEAEVPGAYSEERGRAGTQE